MDILKIDCEGCEYSVLEPLVHQLRPEQEPRLQVLSARSSRLHTSPSAANPSLGATPRSSGTPPALLDAQVLLELHGSRDYLPSTDAPEAAVEKLMRAINKTHGIYYREPNIQHSDGTCIEFALRRRGGVVMG